MNVHIFCVVVALGLIVIGDCASVLAGGPGGVTESGYNLCSAFCVLKLIRVNHGAGTVLKS